MHTTQQFLFPERPKVVAGVLSYRDTTFSGRWRSLSQRRVWTGVDVSEVDCLALQLLGVKVLFWR